MELAAFGFWIFIAAAAVAGIWSDVKTKENKQKALQDLLNNSDKIDPQQMEKMMSIINGQNANLSRDLKIGGLITLFVAPGLLTLGWFISLRNPNALMPLAGTAALVLFISAGLLTAARFVEKHQNNQRPY